MDDNIRAIMTNTALTSDSTVDVSCDKSANFVPVTHRSVCYIVGAVLFDSAGRILLIQEAKQSCYGLWYLPAGRLERGETLCEGAKREVQEEAGLEFEPTSLLCVEFGSGTWYRFMFHGNITGGHLKTLAEKDEESLQAGWFHPDEIMNRKIPLRYFDILPVIAIALKHRQKSQVCSIPACLPHVNPHKQLMLRIMLCHFYTKDLRASTVLFVLVNTLDHLHLPVTLINPSSPSLDGHVSSIIQASCCSTDFTYNLHGVLRIEYCGDPPGENDGICLTLLAEIKLKDNTSETIPLTSSFMWHKITDDSLTELVQQNIQNKYSIPFLDIQCQ